MEDSAGGNNLRRREPHTRVALPVRLWGMDSNGSPFVQNVQTVDVSATGACVSGVTARLKVGEVIGVQHGAEKARFRVIWVKAVEGVGFDVGLSAVDEAKCLWPSHLPAPNDTGTIARPSDRRRNVRIPCNGSVEFAQYGNSYRMWATVTDISAGGCYLQTVSTMPVNSQVELKITVDQLNVNCVGVVRTSHPSIGMGVQFQALHGANQQKLHAILESLETAQGDKLPMYMRVLSHIERIRECLGMIDQIIRQDPARMVPVLADSISGVQAQVNQLLEKQRGAVTQPAEAEPKVVAAAK
jgi:hypothetical protein